jgi:small basic protein
MIRPTEGSCSGYFASKIPAIGIRFFENLAACLAVAVSDIGGLKRGMTGWASFGRDPASFAAVISAAVQAAGQRVGSYQAFLHHTWDTLVTIVATRLELFRERAPVYR